MPDNNPITRTQTLFLRSFRNSPTGPTPDQWPSPSILRRWLRSPGFVAALNSIRDALRFQLDFQLATAAAQAAQILAAPGAQFSQLDLKRLSDLLRLAHLRQRFPAEPKLDSPATFDMRQEIRAIDESIEGFHNELRELDEKQKTITDPAARELNEKRAEEQRNDLAKLQEQRANFLAGKPFDECRPFKV